MTGETLKFFQEVVVGYKPPENTNKFIRTVSRNLIADALGLNDPEDKKIDEVLECQSASANFGLKAFSLSMASVVARLMFGDNSLFDRRVDESEPAFGYEEFADSVFYSLEGTGISDFGEVDDVKDFLSSVLHVQFSDIEAEDYYAGGSECMLNDMKLLLDLLKRTSITDGYNTWMLHVIADDDNFADDRYEILESIMKVYESLLQDGFGTNPYVGVLRDGSSFIECKNGKAIKIERKTATLFELARRMHSRIGSGIKISDNRQFDFDEIYGSDKVVYYPYKMLEYACGLETTEILNRNDYSYIKTGNGASFQLYSQNYLRPNVENMYLKGLYKALEKAFLKTFEGKYPKGFIDEQFTKDYSPEQYKGIIDRAFVTGDNMNFVKGLLVKLRDSMVCAYVLSRMTISGNILADLGIRLSSGSKFDFYKGTVGEMEELYKNIVSQNSNESFHKPYDMTEGVLANGKALPVRVFSYQYDCNPSLKLAAPNWGYRIHEENIKRNTKASWQRILIGESYSGQELYSVKDSSGISMQNNLVHNVYAGSRSGKGVMTMNILAAAISDTGKKGNKVGKPVFYLDRKPDMAIVMYNLSGGGMFSVNGGLLTPLDPGVHNPFDLENGEAAAFWTKSKVWLSANPEVAKLFSADCAPSPYFDLVYLRAFMFCMGLLCLRHKFKLTDKQTYDEVFNGEDGIAIVLDELTGFETGISSLIGNWNGDAGSEIIRAAIQCGSQSEIKKNLDDLQSKIKLNEAKLAEEQAKGEKAKDSTIISLNMTINQYREEYKNAKSVGSLYASAFFGKLSQSWQVFSEMQKAGFKGIEELYSDIFVLGQELPQKFWEQGCGSNEPSSNICFFQLTADKKKFKEDVNGASIVRSVLNLYSNDWFLGRNDTMRAGDVQSDSEVDKVRNKDGNWDYIGKQTTRDVINNIHIDKHVLFKPYLVLNDSNPDSVCVKQCKNRISETSHIDGLGDKYFEDLARDNGGQYPIGIGFPGLVQTAVRTSDPSCSDVTELMQKSLSRSGGIANFVANKMGYSCWQELLWDFSPRGLFSITDMINAFFDEEQYAVPRRLKIMYDLGIIDANGQIKRDGGGEVSGGVAPGEGAYANIKSEPDSGFTGVSQPVFQAGQQPAVPQQSGGMQQPVTGTQPQVPQEKPLSEMSNGERIKYARLQRLKSLQVTEENAKAVENTIKETVAEDAEERQGVRKLSQSEIEKVVTLMTNKLQSDYGQPFDDKLYKLLSKMIRAFLVNANK